MSKNDSLKDSMKGGLNGLFSSTAPAKNSLSKDNLSEEKEKVVHCNFLINLKSASNLNGNLNGSKELEHYASG